MPAIVLNQETYAPVTGYNLTGADTLTITSDGILKVRDYFSAPAIIQGVGSASSIRIDGTVDVGWRGRTTSPLVGILIKETGITEGSGAHRIHITGALSLPYERAIVVQSNHSSDVASQGVEVIVEGKLYGGYDADALNDFMFPDPTAAAAFVGADGDDKITVSGKILGTVMMHGGNNTLINTGRLESYIEFGAGHDRFIQSGEALASVFMGEGNDFYDGRLGSALEYRAIRDPFYNGIIDLHTGNDIAYGSNGADTIYGGAGDDTISGGEGADVLYGDLRYGGTPTEGTDTVSYESAKEAVYVSLNPGDDPKFFLGEAKGDVLHRFENLIGSKHGDRLNGSAVANVLDGGKGTDTLDGGLGDDTYHVDSAKDVIYENSKSDLGDTVIASASYTLGRDVTIEYLRAAAGNAAINLTGNEYAQEIHGNSGRNGLKGGGGGDTLIGGEGDDVYYVNSLDDVIIEEAGGGNDTIIIAWNGTGPSSVANVENIIREAKPEEPKPEEPKTPTNPSTDPGNKNTTVDVGTDQGGSAIGTPNNNKMVGGKGKDTLDGAAGDDTLWGMSGNDRLIGGAGKDAFVFSTKTNKKTNVDKIVDFSVADDSIWLDNKIFTKLGKAGSEANPKLLKKAFFKVGSKATDKNDYVIYDKKKGVLYYDQDGSGSKKAVEIAMLSKKLALTHKDFFVI